MGVLVLLNQRERNVIFVRLTDEMVCEISDKYGNDVESWIAETELEEKFHFEMTDCSYMLLDEMPEMYGCDAATGEETALSLFS